MKRDLHQKGGPWIFYKKFQINYFSLPNKMIRDRVDCLDRLVGQTGWIFVLQTQHIRVFIQRYMPDF